MEAFNELKLKHNHRYVMYAMNDAHTEIRVLKKAAPTATYDDFVAELPENECRYGVFDYEFEEDGRKQGKILFVVWAPDTSKIKAKMLYASSKANFKKKLVGIGHEIQATCIAEVDEDAVREKVTRV